MIYGNPLMISAAGGGGLGGLDLNIVNGTNKPSLVKENTIWFQSTTTIGDIYLQSVQPTSTNVGDVWIHMGLREPTGTISVRSLKVMEGDANFTLDIVNVYQYNGTSWVPQSIVSLYKDGAWVDLYFVAMKDGNLGTDQWYAGTISQSTSYNTSSGITGPKIISAPYTLSFTLRTNSIVAGQGYAAVYMDITPYVRVEATYTAGSYSSITSRYMGINQNLPTTYSASGAFSTRLSMSNANTLYSLDISGATGYHYVGMAISYYSTNLGTTAMTFSDNLTSLCLY